MGSPTSLEAPDSRISSADKKRGFNLFATLGKLENNVIPTGDNSSDEGNLHMEKRARYSGEVEIDDDSPNKTPETSQNVTGDRNSPESASFQDGERCAEPSKDVPASSIGKVDVDSAIQPPTSWNKGISCTIRTSFAAPTPQTQALSTEVSSNKRTLVNPEIDLASTLADIPKRASNKKPLKGLEIDKATTTNKVSKKTDDGESSTEIGKDIKQSRALALLPSSFGSRSNQKLAESIIQQLPEASRDMASREVAKSALSFHEREQTFKLPQTLHKDMPMPCLPRLSFRHPTFGFVRAFMNENRSLLDFIDYDLLVRAFRKYLELFYGYLPAELIKLVGYSKYIVGSKSEIHCLRLLDEAKKLQPKLEGKNTLGQIESETPRPESFKELSKNLESQSYDGAEKSRNPEPYSMSLLQEIKGAQSQMAGQVEGENKIFDEVGAVHIPDQVGTEQKPTDDAIEVELVHRYHPSHDQYPLARYCLTCADTNHKTSECPLLTCATCGLRGIHFTDGCPKTQCCTKCHERGHQKSDCPEKLTANAHEDLRCGICNSGEHLDSACRFLWRSFRPGFLKTTRLVADIPIYCYCCGSRGHYGTECGIRRSPLYTDGYTWSKLNWMRYVDPKSSNQALSAVEDHDSPLYPKAKKNFSIRGRAQNWHDPSRDDDEDVPFIRERVNKDTHMVRKGFHHIKFDRARPDNDYVPRDTEPPVPDSRQQPFRAAKSTQQQKPYKDRPRDDSARHIRERSFSPPPQFHEELYDPRPEENYYRPGYNAENYRPYERGVGDFSGQARTQRVHGKDNHEFKPGGLTQRVRPVPEGPRVKRQRNRNR